MFSVSAHYLSTNGNPKLKVSDYYLFLYTHCITYSYVVWCEETENINYSQFQVILIKIIEASKFPGSSTKGNPSLKTVGYDLFFT